MKTIKVKSHLRKRKNGASVVKAHSKVVKSHLTKSERRKANIILNSTTSKYGDRNAEYRKNRSMQMNHRTDGNPRQITTLNHPLTGGIRRALVRSAGSNNRYSKSHNQRGEKIGSRN